MAFGYARYRDGNGLEALMRVTLAILILASGFTLLAGGCGGSSATPASPPLVVNSTLDLVQ